MAGFTPVTNMLRPSYADPIGVDQLKRKNALADHGMEMDRQQNALAQQTFGLRQQAFTADQEQQQYANRVGERERGHKLLGELGGVAGQILSMPAHMRRAAAERLRFTHAEAFRAEGLDPNALSFNDVDDAGLEAELKQLAAYGPQADPNIAAQAQATEAADNRRHQQSLAQLGAQARYAAQDDARGLDNALKLEGERGVQTRETQARAAMLKGTGVDKEAAEKEDAKNKAVDMYTAARDGLMKGLGGTETGPVAGRIPAVTTGQQVAEGSVAAMAPVLKQLFRVSGEGVFTDRDQALLLDMVPKRTDSPEARELKMKNIDGIVSAKLGQKIGGQQGTAPPAAIEHLRKNPQLKEAFKAKYGYLPSGI